MWVDFHKILAKHLYAFNMFRFVSIRYDIDCCEECLPCVDDGMHQAIYLLYEINILFTLCFFRYITWCRFVFLRKNLWTSKTWKQTSFVPVLMQEKHNNHTWHVVIDEAKKRTYKIIGCEKGMLNFFLGAWKCRL